MSHRTASNQNSNHRIKKDSKVLLYSQEQGTSLVMRTASYKKRVVHRWSREDSFLVSRETRDKRQTSC